jgi:hypothetical protein
VPIARQLDQVEIEGIYSAANSALWYSHAFAAGTARSSAREEDYVSTLVTLAVPVLGDRWSSILAPKGIVLRVSGVFCHGHPQVEFGSPSSQVELADVLGAEVKRGGQSDDDVKYETFLAETLGWFDLPDIVVPPLEQAMQPGLDREVRKGAIWAIAIMAERTEKNGDSLQVPGLINELTMISRDDDPLIRQIGAFTLGFFSDVEARTRLEVMIEDSDSATRVNAAIALVRHGDARGAGVFRDVLKSAAEPKEPGSDAEFEQFLSLKNCIIAVDRLAGALSAAERHELASLLEPIAAEYREPGIRIAARNALSTMRAAR